MVSSRHRTSTTSATADTSITTASNTSASITSSKLTKAPLDEWTTKEKLHLASLAIKHNNAWNTVARNMQSFAEKERPEGWSNQKTCAAQFDKLMNELGVDKRPKRNEHSSGNSSSVIYKKMSEKRIKELEDNIHELRKSWLGVTKSLKNLEGDIQVSDKPETKPKSKTTSTAILSTSTSTTTSTATASSRACARSSTTSESEKPPTRALTRRESSRQNIEKTLAVLCKDASEVKGLNLMTKPSQELERENYDKVILRHMDMTIIKKRLGGEIDDPYAVMNDLLLMFQNATMFYPPEHHVYKTAVELREKLVPQWEKALLDRFRAARH